MAALERSGGAMLVFGLGVLAALLAPAAGGAPAAAPTGGSPPVGVLDEEPDCSQIARVRAAAPSAWHPLATPSPRGKGGDVLWVRVEPPPASRDGWTLAMPSNRAFALSTYAPPRYDGETIDAADPRGWLLSFRYLGREVRGEGGPSYLCFSGPRLGEDEIVQEPTPVFRRRDLAATQLRAAAFGVMLATSLFSALLYLTLSETVFLKYLGYLLVFVLYLACETRAAYRVFTSLTVTAGLCATGMAIDVASAFVFLFAVEFMSLHRLAPRAARVLRLGAGSLLALALAHAAGFALDSQRLVRASVVASDALVGGGGLLLLFAAARCATRGERYARLFLLGWTPLVFIAFWASFQQIVDERTLGVTLDFMLAGGAFESVVLAFGLADRALGYRRELERATQLADRDPLSGLLNRRALLRLSRALDGEGERRGGTLAIVIFDLDFFKKINDEHGHGAGDVCIRAFADQLSAEMRRSDLAARYGGEEFLAVLPGATGEVASALAERVRVRVEKEGAAVDGARIRMTVSAGVAVGDAAQGFERVLSRADHALYSAKNAGRNRVVAEAVV